jgi:hypothetical protein
MRPGFLITVVLPCLFGVMAVFFLVIGLRGLLTKKPFLISGRWLLVIVLLGFAPGMIQAVALPSIGNEPGMITAFRLITPAMLFAVIIFWYFTLTGYIAFGVTDTSFREGLLASLRTRDLDYKESLSVVRLPTIGADLQVAVQSCLGTGQIRVKQRHLNRVLSNIVSGMNDYYQNHEGLKTNLTCCIFYVALGVFMGAFAGLFLFGFSKILRT